jgi:transmembrane sensor
MPDQKRKEFQRLVDKYLNGTATPEEQEALDRYFLLFKDEPESTGNLNLNQLARLEERMESELFGRIAQPGKSNRIWPRIVAAASVLVALSAGGYFILHKQQPTQQVAQNQNDIMPGSNKAILKLANGRRLVITGAKNGLLAQQGNTSITKTADGKLAYQNTASAANGVMLYDTLIVPRGGQHQVKFADGTIAYINADTKLRIPESFEGKDRTIEVITGEAIFKVAYNAKVPFYVKHKGQITEDLGTEFDVNAYPDEPATKTTLIEGRVRITANGQTENLKPGQQALIGTGTTIKIKNVDLEEITAWRNGYFDLNDENLESIMRKVSRWYDVDVIYTDNSLKTQVFAGTVSRFKTVSEVLRKMEFANTVHFKIEGHKVIVNK